MGRPSHRCMGGVSHRYRGGVSPASMGGSAPAYMGGYIAASGLSVASRCIQLQEDKEKDGKAQQGGATITEEGEGYADDGRHAEHHPDIDGEVEDEYGGDRIPVHTCEGRILPLCQMYQPKDEHPEEDKHCRRPHEALFLPNRTKDKVGILLRNILQLCLRTVEEPFPQKAPGPYGNLGLVDVISRATGVVL